MELSEAIKAGAKVHPQTYDRMWEKDGARIVGTCALGAAAVAAGVGTYFLSEAFPLLNEPIETFPCGCKAETLGLGVGHNVSTVVMHLNDDHHLTREQIAAWVKRLEK